MFEVFDYFRGYIQVLRDKEEGQTLVEYALILALVSIAAVATLGFLSGAINGVLSTVAGAL